VTDPQPPALVVPGEPDTAAMSAAEDIWRERAEAAEARLLELENAITWHTDCTRCAGFLDRARSAEERAERAEGKLAGVRAVLLEGGQDAGTVRRRALAITGSEGEPCGH
jgi:hypothetical protein